MFSPSASSLNRLGLLSSRHPLRSLTVFFCLWKTLLFLSIAACPGPGYDTSTTLLPDHTTSISDVASSAKDTSSLSIPLRFVRWDSIYFVHVVDNGYVFEQEWAFGYGYTKVLRFLASGTWYLISGTFWTDANCHCGLPSIREPRWSG